MYREITWLLFLCVTCYENDMGHNADKHSNKFYIRFVYNKTRIGEGIVAHKFDELHPKTIGNRRSSP